MDTNQMNSIYRPMTPRPKGHRTSLIAIIVFLIIAIIVAVLGFGRIKDIKHDDAQRGAQQNSQAPRSAPLSDSQVYSEIEAVSTTDISGDTEGLDSEFK